MRLEPIKISIILRNFLNEHGKVYWSEKYLVDFAIGEIARFESHDGAVFNVHVNGEVVFTKKLSIKDGTSQKVDVISKHAVRNPHLDL